MPVSSESRGARANAKQRRAPARDRDLERGLKEAARFEYHRGLLLLMDDR